MSGSARSVTILGSTGTIGANTLEVIRRSAGRFRVAGLDDLIDAHLLGLIAADRYASGSVLAAADHQPAAVGPDGGSELFGDKLHCPVAVEQTSPKIHLPTHRPTRGNIASGLKRSSGCRKQFGIAVRLNLV